jgi:hypothetical protein
MKNMGEKFFALEKCSTFVLVKFVALQNFCGLVRQIALRDM